MSVPVEIERLREEAAKFATMPYLVTVGADNRPHVVAVAPEWSGTTIVVGGGKRTLANAGDRPELCLLWPPPEPGGYSLIADVTAQVDGEHLHLQPTKAVLHRPAAGGGSDCVPVS